MQNKLQELTDKIYQEGLLKAKDEASEILSKANAEAARIIANAQNEAAAIVSNAKQQADDARRNLESELKMSAIQAVSAVKQQIAELVTCKVVDAPVGKLFGDTEFLKTLITTLVKGYTQSGELDLNIVLPVAAQTEMEQFFKNSLTNELTRGLTVEYSKQINAGFKVGPKDKSFVVGFSDDDFANFFKAYLRPKTARILFDQ